MPPDPDNSDGYPTGSTNPSACPRGQVWCCLVVTLAVVALKLWIAQDIKASALFADDYEYLNKSPYYLRGDLLMESYPHYNVSAGVVYSLVVSPWLLVDDPGWRIYVVHAINILLSGVTIFLGSRTIARLSGSDHFLPPLCLAAMPTLFLFSFHALTENLVFALLAVVAWLVLDFERTCLRRERLTALLAAVGLLPLVRAPGMAVVPGLILLAWLHRHRLGPRRAWGVLGGVVGAAVLPYLLYATFAPSMESHSRESYYLKALTALVKSPEHMAFALRLAGNQAAYLLIGGGYWILPVLLVVAAQVRRWAPSPLRTQWRNYLTFAGPSAVVFVGFCVAHRLLRYHFDWTQAHRIVGRYNDPAMVLILFGGIAAAFVLGRLRWEALLLYGLAPMGLCLAVSLIAGTSGWGTVNQSGAAFFTNYRHGLTASLLGTVGAVLLVQLAPWRRWRIAAWLGGLLVYFLVADIKTIGTTDHPGSVRIRAAQVAQTQRAAEWIHRNVPKSARLGCDAAVSSELAVGPFDMGRVYTAFWFSTYPRPNFMVNTPDDLRQCDYLFTKADAANLRGLPVAWTDGILTLCEVPADAPTTPSTSMEANLTY